MSLVSHTDSALDPNEYGPLTSRKYLYVQRRVDFVDEASDDFVPYIVVLKTYLMYGFLIVLGHIHDFFARILDPRFRENMFEKDGYAPLTTDFDSFYSRRLKQRLTDCFARPTEGVPGRKITVWDRRYAGSDFFKPLVLTGERIRCINLSSYNYLGFAQSKGDCSDAAVEAAKELGLVGGATRFAGGTLAEHLKTERVVAEFVGKEAAMIYNMGYSTNANLFVNLLDKRCLVISDELNHASIRTGLRLSGAVLRVFKHNDMHHLEELLREAISQGQPRSHRPWRKIMVCVEGLYSMEGTMCDLPKLVELRKKYGFYLFVDEAHSIGAMGPHGRGICDYFSISSSEIDIMMGTFTKSFGATGGYVAGSRELVEALKSSNLLNVYGETTTPPVLAQIQTSLLTIMGKINPGEAQERLQRIAFNSRYLRLGLIKMGFIVFGHIDSPIIPVMLYLPALMPYLSREFLRHGIAIVVVGYPATPLISCRIRLCMSSAVTKEDLDYVLEMFEKLAANCRFSKQLAPNGKPYRQKWAEMKDTLVDIARNPATSTTPPL